MSEVKWIKLSTSIFDNRKIRQIEKMPEGDALIVIWLKLLILAGNVNDGGLVYFTKEIPYTDQLLATQFDRPLSVIQLAISTFLKFEMIDVVDDLICISNWEKYQNVERLEQIREQNRLRQKRWYDSHKLLSDAKPNVSLTKNLTLPNATDIEVDKEKDKDKELDLDTTTIIRKWNELGLNTVRDVKGNRKTLLQARIKEHGLDAVLEALDKVADSDFLHGQNDSGWMITFDWFVRPQNFQKVLEGNYANRKKKDQVVKDEHILDDLLKCYKPKRDLDQLLDDLDKI